MKSTSSSAETFDELAPRQATGGFALEKTLATMAHRDLYKFQKFFELFPILDTLCPESSSLLPWSHFRTLLQVSKPEARQWYIKEASEQGWSVRTLQRNISRGGTLETMVLKLV